MGCKMLDYGVFFLQIEDNHDFLSNYDYENWKELDLDVLEQNVRRSLVELEEKMEKFLSFLKLEEEEIEVTNNQEECDDQSIPINY
jgi:hypothetical protein